MCKDWIGWPVVLYWGEWYNTHGNVYSNKGKQFFLDNWIKVTVVIFSCSLLVCVQVSLEQQLIYVCTGKKQLKTVCRRCHTTGFAFGSWKIAWKFTGLDAFEVFVEFQTQTSLALCPRPAESWVLVAWPCLCPCLRPRPCPCPRVRACPLMVPWVFVARPRPRLLVPLPFPLTGEQDRLRVGLTGGELGRDGEDEVGNSSGVEVGAAGEASAVPMSGLVALPDAVWGKLL